MGPLQAPRGMSFLNRPAPHAHRRSTQCLLRPHKRQEMGARSNHGNITFKTVGTSSTDALEWTKAKKRWRIHIYIFAGYISERKHMWDGDSDTLLFQRAKKYIYVFVFWFNVGTDAVVFSFEIWSLRHYGRLHIYGRVLWVLSCREAAWNHVTFSLIDT